MVNSSTDICNLALDLLSADTAVDIENPTTATESIMNRWYDQTRKAVLRKHTWNFATKRIILAADSTSPVFGYSKAFTVPSDFLRIVGISTNLSTDKEYFLPTDAYQFENSKILLNDTYSDTTQLRLIYIYDATEVGRFDPLFVNLLAHEIALATAYKITESGTNIQRLEELRRNADSLATTIDGQERPPETILRSRALSARRRAGKTSRADRIIF